MNDETNSRIRQICEKEGHRPHINSGQGLTGLIYGCYCGKIHLKKPISIPEPETWEDLPGAEFDKSSLTSRLNYGEKNNKL